MLLAVDQMHQIRTITQRDMFIRSEGFSPFVIWSRAYDLLVSFIASSFGPVVVCSVRLYQAKCIGKSSVSRREKWKGR